jgi:uncharacterized small protein (DUF1192 family)
MGVGNMKFLRLLPLLLLFSGFSLAQTAEDLNISQSEMIEIENRISSMSVNDLNARKALLNDEIASLEVEQEETQNPTRNKEIAGSINRSFLNGTKFGVFASFTDVSSEQFGEGTFDKGIFFNIPVYGNFINYSWRPLTKDPGAKLNRKHTLHDLLIKFKPYNY